IGDAGEEAVSHRGQRSASDQPERDGVIRPAKTQDEPGDIHRRQANQRPGGIVRVPDGQRDPYIRDQGATADDREEHADSPHTHSVTPAVTSGEGGFPHPSVAACLTSIRAAPGYRADTPRHSVSQQRDIAGGKAFKDMTENQTVAAKETATGT